jgi:GTP-binding protein EngB required for normal cell division
VSELGASDQPLSEAPSNTVRLNDSQRLHLRVSLQYMDQLLQDVEGVLHSAESKSPFPRYLMDLSPAQGRVLEDYIRRFRSQLVRALAWQKIDPPSPGVPATRAISTRLHFVDNALADMRPKEMRGSGSLSEEAAAELTGVMHELSSLAENMMNFVYQEVGESLVSRIEGLAGDEIEKEQSLLRRVERVVTLRGLVEFRPRIEMLLSRLEDKTYEVAVFGRVSSGKSSFLNGLLGTALLPVGVNPITAVPTRIRYGKEVGAFLRYGNGEMREVPLDEFRATISESGNPGNQRTVTRALLEVPSERLSEGIVLVDTPGLGSLAQRGAAETIAYLPSCDLALLLIDAGSTLTAEDIGTLRLILEAGIPALVLLSKSDLLRPDDIQSTVSYIESQIGHELRTSLPVHPLSSIKDRHVLLEKFFAEELLPRLQRATELKVESVASKLRRLQHDVIASLETKIRRAEHNNVISTPRPDLVENRLREISGGVGELGPWLQRRIETLRGASPTIISKTAQELSERLSESPSDFILPSDITEHLQVIVNREIDSLIAKVNEVALKAVDATSHIGTELGRADTPSREELELLIRNVPRFISVIAPTSISIGFRRYLGQQSITNHLEKSMKRSFGSLLQAELGDYTIGLSQWAQRLAQGIQSSVNSYVETFRVAVQESMSETASQTGPAELRDDIQTLLTGKTEQPVSEYAVLKGA